jgi:hypothetical protein
MWVQYPTPPSTPPRRLVCAYPPPPNSTSSSHAPKQKKRNRNAATSQPPAPISCSYHHLCLDRSRRITMARRHSNNPWAIPAVLAALVLLMLDSGQVVYGVHVQKRHHEFRGVKRTSDDQWLRWCGKHVCDRSIKLPGGSVF